MQFNVSAGRPSAVHVKRTVSRCRGFVLNGNSISATGGVEYVGGTMGTCQKLSAGIISVSRGCYSNLISFLRGSCATRFKGVDVAATETFVCLFDDALGGTITSNVVYMGPLHFIGVRNHVAERHPLGGFLAISRVHSLVGAPYPMVSEPRIGRTFVLDVFACLSSTSILSLG